jgi:hypothetical protein
MSRSRGEWVERVLQNVCYNIALATCLRETLFRLERVARAAALSSIDERERERESGEATELLGIRSVTRPLLE